MDIARMSRSCLPRSAWGALHLPLLVLLLCIPAFAGEDRKGSGTPEDSGRQQALRRRILEEENRSRPRTIGLVRLRASHPQKISAGFGWMRTRIPANHDCLTVCGLKGPIFQVEPGLSGAQLSAGYARLIGEKRTSKHFLRAVYVGFGVKAVLLRTYGNSPLTPEDQTLAGVEGDFTVASANFSLGVMRSFSQERERDWTMTFGLGWGF